MAKLFYCSAYGVGEDYHGHFIADNEDQAKKMFERSLDNEGIWNMGADAWELRTVGGYRIRLNKVKSGGD